MLMIDVGFDSGVSTPLHTSFFGARSPANDLAFYGPFTLSFSFGHFFYSSSSFTRYVYRLLVTTFLSPFPFSLLDNAPISGGCLFFFCFFLIHFYCFCIPGVGLFVYRPA